MRLLHKLKSTLLAYQLTQVFNFTNLLSGSLTRKSTFFQNGRHFSEKVQNEKTFSLFMDNSHIHLHFKFHANPANGFEIKGFETKYNQQVVAQ